MNYKLLEYQGYSVAMMGAMLSYGKTSWEDVIDYPQINPEVERRFPDLAVKLASSGPGHDKFLEQIQYWMGIQAPLYWWKQFDTYRIGISKSSESTMHRSWKDGLNQEMFEAPIYAQTLKALNSDILDWANENDPTVKAEREARIINNLPDGYLQTRIVNVNAKTLRNIYFQRRNHKLALWRDFCKWLKEIPYGCLITIEEVEKKNG